MKLHIVWLGACLIFAIWPRFAWAQYSLTGLSGLNFGQILFASNGTITVSPNGSALGGGGAIAMGGSDSADFTATCPPNQAISISANTPVTIPDNGGSGSGDMTITSISHNAPSACDSFGNLGNFSVGAQLRFGTTSPQSGPYSINLDITIDNQ